ncbi:MAG: peroxiredoxin [Pseudomonadota bacterium]
MLTAGSRAPEFVLSDETNSPVALSELLADGALILYFYPADFTPGCTKEACSIRDMHEAIQSAGLRVAGVSPQDADSHARFRDQHRLPFTLLCDPDKRVIKLYDVDGPFGMGVRRVTYLIEPNGDIADAVQADLRIGRHREFIERAMSLSKSAAPASDG